MSQQISETLQALNVYKIVDETHNVRDLLNFFLNEEFINKLLCSELHEVKTIFNNYKIISNKKDKETYFLERIECNTYKTLAMVKYEKVPNDTYLYINGLCKDKLIEKRYFRRDNNGSNKYDEYQDNNYYFIIVSSLPDYIYDKNKFNEIATLKLNNDLLIDKFNYLWDEENDNDKINICKKDDKILFNIKVKNCYYLGSTFGYYKISTGALHFDIYGIDKLYNLGYHYTKYEINQFIRAIERDYISEYIPIEYYNSEEEDEINDNYIIPVKKRLIAPKNPKNDLLNHLNTNFINYKFSYCGDNNDNFYCENYFCGCFHRIEGLKMTTDTLFIDSSKFDDCELLERTIIIEIANYMNIKRVWEAEEIKKLWETENFNMRECIEYELNDIINEDNDAWINEDIEENISFDTFYEKQQDTEDIIFNGHNDFFKYLKYLDYNSKEKYFYYRNTPIGSISAYEIRIDKSSFESNRFNLIKRNLCELCRLCNFDYTEY